MLNGVCEGSSGVDNTLGTDLEFLTTVCVLVQGRENIPTLDTCDLAVGILLEAGYLEMVEHSSTVKRSSQSKGDVHSRVVVLAVVVNQSANHVVSAEEWEFSPGLALGHKVGALEALGTGKEIIGLGAAPHVRCLPPLLKGEENRDRVRQVRGNVEESPALAEGFNNELELGVIEVHDGLLEVAHASMDELGALRAGTRRKVVALNKSNLQTTSGGVDGDASTGSATANDQKVVLGIAGRAIVASKVVELLLAAFESWEGGGYDSALAVALGLNNGHGNGVLAGVGVSVKPSSSHCCSRSSDSEGAPQRL